MCAPFRFRVSHRAKRAGDVSPPSAVVVACVSDTPSSRRPGAALFCVAASVVLLHPSASHAETLKQMTVAGGNASFLEREFVDLKYAGVKTVTPGTAAIDGFTEATECVSVTYDADKIQFASLMRTYWQHADPTNQNGSFAEKGDRFKGAVWVWDEFEREEVTTAVSNLKASGIFGVDKAKTPYALVNLRVEQAPAKNFVPFPEERKKRPQDQPETAGKTTESTRRKLQKPLGVRAVLPGQGVRVREVRAEVPERVPGRFSAVPSAERGGAGTRGQHKNNGTELTRGPRVGPATTSAGGRLRLEFESFNATTRCTYKEYSSLPKYPLTPRRSFVSA